MIFKGEFKQTLGTNLIFRQHGSEEGEQSQNKGVNVLFHRLYRLGLVHHPSQMSCFFPYFLILVIVHMTNAFLLVISRCRVTAEQRKADKTGKHEHQADCFLQSTLEAKMKSYSDTS